MADKIPHNFTEAGERAIATYDYVDISEGRGVVIFYAGEAADSNFLSRNAFYSENIVVTGAGTETTFTSIHDKDYDTTFRLPQRVQGPSLVTVTLGTYNSEAATTQAYVTVRARKWDGTNETELASNNSDTFSTGAVVGATTSSHTVCVDLDIPKTHFKAGETLRLSIEMFYKITVGTATVGFGQDPKDRNDDTTPKIIEDADTTSLEFHVPFIIDL